MLQRSWVYFSQKSSCKSLESTGQAVQAIEPDFDLIGTAAKFVDSVPFQVGFSESLKNTPAYLAYIEIFCNFV